jgi:hypothetical protein
MEHPPSEQDARQSLNLHVAQKGHEIHLKYGPNIGWAELQRILEDRSCVRYPCAIQFGEDQLQPGEVAYAQPMGPHPEDGFIIHLHPSFSTALDKVPFLVLYQLVVVNYGPFASAADAEIFGANALGLDQDTYYSTLCRLADGLNRDNSV